MACGVSHRLFFEDKMSDGVHDLTDNKLHLPNYNRSFLRYHVYYTVRTRRILNEMGVPLQGDTVFNQKIIATTSQLITPFELSLVLILILIFGLPGEKTTGWGSYLYG